MLKFTSGLTSVLITLEGPQPSGKQKLPKIYSGTCTKLEVFWKTRWISCIVKSVIGVWLTDLLKVSYTLSISFLTCYVYNRP